VRVDTCIPNGVPVRPQRLPLDGAPLIAFAGRLVRKKGVDVLLRAMPATLAAIPDARLVIAGDGPERPGLETLAAALGIGHAVEFLGHLPRDDAERALARAWAQAVPSRWEEPFGLVAAEAMMRGTAVIATGPSGLAEQVTEGETGYLVPPGDAAALAQALVRVLGDRAGAERLGAAGRIRALDLFSEDRHVERVLGVFRQLVGGDVPSGRGAR
jgi:glycosyltransferase involved in cell wall biosynthesis